MNFNKYKGLFFPILIVMVIGMLFVYIAVQFEVDKFGEQIRSLEKEISDTDVEIKILKTEISHLTSVSRVREVADNYLKNFRNIKNNDFINGMNIPLNPNLE